MQTERNYHKSTEKCSNHEILLEQLKNYQGGKNCTQRRWHGPTTWKDMLHFALRDIANWPTERQSSFSKSQVLAWMTIISRNRNSQSVGELSKACSQIVLKCLYLARIGRLDILWSVNKLARSGTKLTGTRDNRSPRLISYVHHTSE